MRSQGCLLDSGLSIQKPMRGPQFTAGFLSLYYFDTEFLNVKGLIELQNAKENAQGTTDHNYNLQKNTWTMGAPENPRHSEQIVLGEPDTSESKFQLADGLTQPGEDRGRMGVGTPLSISTPGTGRYHACGPLCAQDSPSLWKVAEHRLEFSRFGCLPSPSQKKTC